MYKRREAAIAELVANSWDAGSSLVQITVPAERDYDRATSEIVILDRGRGMSFAEIRDEYLVLGRNRRNDPDGEGDGKLEVEAPEDAPEPTDDGADQDPIPTRRVMGRKGIGKLAGFGLGKVMTVTTWRSTEAISFTLDVDKLKAEDNEAPEVLIEWVSTTPPNDWVSGTQVVLSGLKHKSAINPENLKVALARRFSRSIQGRMQIEVNAKPLPDPTPPLDLRFPEGDSLEEETLPDGHVIKYWYGFATNVIKNRDLKGFSILVNGKVAQAPPFFFDVETTASGQHSTRYVIGDIEADYLDAGADDDSDVVSTDRQEIDWEDESSFSLKDWGEAKSRRVLSECRDFKGAQTVRLVLEDEDINARVERLDKPARKEIEKFLGILGLRDNEVLEETKALASSLVRAFEFQNFHDVIKDIREVAEDDDPDRFAEFVRRLSDWRVLESRAILEVIEGRQNIIDHFEVMLVTAAPETAPHVGDDNLHDAIARFPWLLNPDWQVFAEEKAMTTQLREWGDEDLAGGDRGRYDFLALSDQQSLVIVEIKRSNHPVEYPELQRLEKYKELLSRAHPDIFMVLIYGGTLNVSDDLEALWEKSEDRELRHWNTVFQKSKRHYARHRALLDADVRHGDFALAESEVLSTREVLKTGSTYRGPERRVEGVGPQDMKFDGDESAE